MKNYSLIKFYNLLNILSSWFLLWFQNFKIYALGIKENMQKQANTKEQSPQWMTGSITLQMITCCSSLVFQMLESSFVESENTVVTRHRFLNITKVPRVDN